jgi:alpha-tubulin suppressor-like RCC1 family protein
LLFGAGCTDLFGLKRVPEPPPVKTPDPGGRVAAGYLYTCSLHDDGTAWCWGRNLENEIQPAFAASVTTPQQIGTATWQSIASVSLATCGVQPDQSAWCWGTLPASGFTADVEPVPIEVDPGPIQRMYPGTFTTCELDAAGELSCRGNNRYGGLGDGTTTDRDTFAPIAEPGPWQTVAQGWSHACAIKVDGSLWCWGDNGAGQLALPDPGPAVTPTRVGSELWSDVAAALDSTCAITQDGHLRCWGANSFGQLGNGTTTAASLPTPVIVDGQDRDGWVHVRASWNDSICAVRDDDSLWCWGRSNHGESGVDAAKVVATPTQVPGAWSEIAVGYAHSCGRRSDGTVWCFGSDGFGELGDGGTSVATPTPVPGMWSSVAVRDTHTCAIDASKQLWCAGQNDFGELGVGTQDAHQDPVEVSAGWTIVDTGDNTTCGVQTGTTQSSGYCWGRNDRAQLGVGDTAARTSPVLVGMLGANPTAGATTSQACALISGYIWCWGPNDRGQVGDGTMVQRTMPVLIAGGTSVDVGEIHSCGINGVNQVTCWGGGSIKAGGTMVPAGTLGQGSDTTDHLDPVVVAGTASTVSLSVGWYDSCAIDNTGHARCWGLNSNGELGLGDSMVHTSASILPNTWSSISLGRTHGCGIRTDKSLWCWGANERGQRGDPSATAAPNQVMAGHSWAQVAAGQSYTCAIDTAGGLYCWGANDDGQLANGAAWRAAPVQAR